MKIHLSIADPALFRRVATHLGYAPDVNPGWLLSEAHAVPRVGERLTIVAQNESRLFLRVVEVEHYVHRPGSGVYVPTVYVKELE